MAHDVLDTTQTLARFTLPAGSRPLCWDVRGDMLLLLDSSCVLSRYVFHWPDAETSNQARGAGGAQNQGSGWFARLFGTGGTQPSHWVCVTDPGSKVECYQVSALRVTCPTYATACAIVPAARDPSRPPPRPPRSSHAPRRKEDNTKHPLAPVVHGVQEESGGVVSAALSLLHFANGDLVVVCAEPGGVSEVCSQSLQTINLKPSTLDP